MNQATKLLTQYVVCEQLGISRPTLWRRRHDDPAFPPARLYWPTRRAASSRLM